MRKIKLVSTIIQKIRSWYAVLGRSLWFFLQWSFLEAYDIKLIVLVWSEWRSLIWEQLSFKSTWTASFYTEVSTNLSFLPSVVSAYKSLGVSVYLGPGYVCVHDVEDSVLPEVDRSINCRLVNSVIEPSSSLNLRTRVRFSLH